MSAALRTALVALREAERAAHDQMVGDYPAGTPIAWDHKSRGVALDHGAGMRIKVRNFRTDRAYWIGAYRITSL